MAQIRDEEEWARQMLEAELGLAVSHHDDGSQPRMCDLVINSHDGVLGAVEVTAAADGESIALWRLVNGADERWQVPHLRGGWTVALAPSARAKAVVRELPALLSQLEARGLDVLDVKRSRGEGSLSQGAHRLGILRAHRGATAFPGSIYLMIELPLDRTAGVVPTSGEPLVEWVEAFLAGEPREDVRLKLAQTGLPERHAFILVPSFTPAPFAVVDLLMRPGAPLPVSAPDLPLAVTHVWVASMWSSGHGVRWCPEQGWTRFAKQFGHPVPGTA